MKDSLFRFGTLFLSSFLILPAVSSAQQLVGVVTAVKGKAQLTRAASQQAIKFREDVILRDIIDTQKKSLARILFGGKSTITIRELSRLEVREETLPTGTTRSIVDLSSGAVLVNVARKLLKPGDEVIVRTPNAVAAVRGSRLWTECPGASGLPDAEKICRVCNLKGDIGVTPEGKTEIQLDPLGCLDITGLGDKVERVTITQDQANQIIAKSDVGELGGQDESGIGEDGVNEAVALFDAATDAATNGNGPPVKPPKTPSPPFIDPNTDDAALRMRRNLSQ